MHYEAHQALHIVGTEPAIQSRRSGYSESCDSMFSVLRPFLLRFLVLLAGGNSGNPRSAIPMRFTIRASVPCVF